MPVPLMIVPAAAFILASACPQSPPTKVHVVGRADEITIGSEFELAQLRELSDRFGRRGKHEPLGFYLSNISGETAVSVRNDRQDFCEGPVEIDVTIRLTNRHIEIGRDLKNNPCQFSAVLEHYQRHAAADTELLQRFVALVIQTLARRTLPDLINEAWNNSSAEKTLAPAIQSIIDPVLDEMHAEQSSVIGAVDTPAEVRRVEQTCRG